jgi:biopolymer transport protein ExbD
MSAAAASAARAIGRRIRPRLSLNLTPMIDVVFQLLIYFMVSTNFAQGEQAYRVDLPARDEGAAADPFRLDEEPLVIELAAGAGGPAAIRIAGPWPQPANAEALFEFLASRQLGPRNPDGLFAIDHPILVSPGPEVRWEDTVDAFNSAVRAGYTRVGFAEAPRR